MHKLIRVIFGIIVWSGSAVPAIAQADAIKRGQYVFTASGCAGCHTDIKNKGTLLAGGRELKTSFGVFYGPNITPDKTHGIGDWNDEDFIRALRHGVAPDGSHYFPVFPYTSYTKLTDQDMRDLKAYLFSLPPSAKPNIPHDIKFPFSIRASMIAWKFLFLETGPFLPHPTRSKVWNRGAYLSEAMVHCGECHTPRNSFGAAILDKAYAGTREGPEGALAPNITSDPETGIGTWSHQEIFDILQIGMLPDGDFTGGAMAEISENTAKLDREDLNAIAYYFKSIPAIPNKVTRK